MSNLDLWNKFRTPDPKYTKEVKFGRGFTAIDPQYQLRLATEEWGPYGTGWGLRDVTFTPFEGSMMMQGEFFYPDGWFPIAVDMKWKADNDTLKKLMTNARSKALSMLGFGADVFMGMFDDVEYVKRAKMKHADHKAFLEAWERNVNGATTEKDLVMLEANVISLREDETVSPDMAMEMIGLILDRGAEIGLTLDTPLMGGGSR